MEVVTCMIHDDGEIQLAQAAELSGRLHDAIAIYEQLERRFQQKDCSSALSIVEAFCCIRRGLILLQVDNREECMRVILRGLALARENCNSIANPHQPEQAQLSRGDCIVLGDQFHEVVRQGRYVVSKLLYFAKDFQTSHAFLHDDVDLGPVDVHYFLAAAQLGMATTSNLSSSATIKQESLGKALKHCQNYLKLCPKAAAAHELMGDIFFHLEDYENAAQMFAKAAGLGKQLEMFGFESRMWWRCGCVAAGNLGRQGEATDNFASSLEAALLVTDATEQAHHLAKAYSWLESCLASITQGSSSIDYDCSSDQDGDQSPHTEPSITRIEALTLLGQAQGASGWYDKARQCFETAVSVMNDEQESLDTGLQFRLQYSLAQILANSGRDCEEALRLFRKCKEIAESKEYKLMCDILAGFSLQVAGRFDEAFEAFTQTMCEYCTLLDTKWDAKARLLVGLGQALSGMGNFVEALPKFEDARTILEEGQAFDSEWLSFAYQGQLLVYMEKRQLWDAYQLIKKFQSISSVCSKSSSHQQAWEYISAGLSNMVAHYEQTDTTLRDVLENQLSSQLDSKWPALKIGILMSLSNAYKNLRDYESARVKCEEARLLVREDDHSTLGSIVLECANIYTGIVENEHPAAIADNARRALDEFEKAVSHLEAALYLDTQLLTKAYLGQAAMLIYLQDPVQASMKLEKARQYVGGDQILMAKAKYIQAHLHELEGSLAEAQAENRDAAILYATIQMQLRDLGSAWVSMLSGEMKHVFFNMQRLLACINKAPDYLKALLWAERGRMRLYFHLTGQQPDHKVKLPPQELSDVDPLWFDKDDDLAKLIIHKALKSCDSQTAIVEYTYSEFEGLYAHVAQQSPDGQILVNFQAVRLRDFFEKKSNSSMGKTLNSLIKRTRSEIRNRADEKAKRGLSVLYRLLVEPIWQYIASCNTVIFAPNEILSVVPFAALYDSTQNVFFIEQKAVGIIPSIRTLYQCFLQQSALEEKLTWSGSAPAFVAGDPQPMGLGLPQLKGAAQEARNVGQQLGVEPVIGSGVTKEAVINGLHSSYVVVLVTHGIKDASFPHGALVMRKQLPADVAASSPSKLRGGDSNQALKMSRASEVLTAEEIGELDGGIHAGLVVLSACQTGEGRVSTEGLLGLGRAVLQAGAASVVLMLWKVDDDSTKDLVTGLFHHLLAGSGQSIVASVQSAMLEMLRRSGSSIYNWAPLVAFGSPSVRLVR